MAQVHKNVPQLNLIPTHTRTAVSIALPSPPRPATVFVPKSFNTFSPVNQNGSFEFDRVLKSGKVCLRVKKKGAWKPSWKPAHLVLRPNLLSIYKRSDETGLYASVTLTDVTAVASVKKTKTDNVFGVFSPSRNHYFQGLSDQDAREWTEAIRVEARADLLDELNLPSPQLPPTGPEPRIYDTTSGDEDGARPVSSHMQWSALHHAPRSRANTGQRRISHLNDGSTNDAMTSQSDFSDLAGSLPREMSSSLPQPWKSLSTTVGQTVRPSTARNASQMSGFDPTNDPERVIRHGWLHCLQSKGGVKSWKRRWTVLRVKNLTFYKDEDEYYAIRVVRMSSVIDAADIDPVSRRKKFCFQIIIEDKTFRLCAPDEEELAKWLGALKSVLARRADPVTKLAEGMASVNIKS